MKRKIIIFNIENDSFLNSTIINNQYKNPFYIFKNLFNQYEQLFEFDPNEPKNKFISDFIDDVNFLLK